MIFKKLLRQLSQRISIDKIDSIENELRDSQKQVEALTKKINQAKAGEIFDNVKQAGDLTVIAAIADVNGMNDLREHC